jgi:hypothetical protein
MPIVRTCVEIALRQCRSTGSLYVRYARDRAVPVGAGVPAGAKHSRPARRPVATSESVDADHTRYPINPGRRLRPLRRLPLGTRNDVSFNSY